MESLRSRRVSAVQANVFGDNGSGRRFHQRPGFRLIEETTTRAGGQTIYDDWYRLDL